MLKQKPIYSTYSQNTGTFGQDGGISKHGLSCLLYTSDAADDPSKV